jgi:hypothetical protein
MATRKRIGLRQVRALKPRETIRDGSLSGFGARRQQSEAVARTVLNYSAFDSRIGGIMSLLYFVAFFLITGTGEAHAYIDPGSGAMLVQVALASIATAGYFLWSKFKLVQTFIGRVNALSKGHTWLALLGACFLAGCFLGASDVFGINPRDYNYVTVFALTVAVAYLFGSFSAVLFLVLSLAGCTYLFEEPARSWRVERTEDVVGMALCAVLSIGVTVLIAKTRRSENGGTSAT